MINLIIFILFHFFSFRNLSGTYNTTFPNKPNPPFNYTGDFTTDEILTKQGKDVITLKGHPMHLHGHSFYVVGMGLGNFNKSNTKYYNLKNPPLLNTIALPKNGWTTIRFIANNPGMFLYLLYNYKIHRILPNYVYIPILIF